MSRRVRTLSDMSKPIRLLANLSWTGKTGYVNNEYNGGIADVTKVTTVPKNNQQGIFLLENLQPGAILSLRDDAITESNYIQNNSGNVTSDAIFNFVYNHSSNEYHFINSNTAPMRFTLYTIYSKQDLYDKMSYLKVGDGETPGGLSNFPFNGNPVDAWEQGVNAQEGSMDPGYSMFTLGSRPTDSPIFRRHFEVHQKRIVELAPGGIHRHFSDHTLNRIFDQSHFPSSLYEITNPTPPGGTSFLQTPMVSKAGVTMFIMAVFEGSVGIQLTAENQQTVAAIGGARLDVYQVRRDTYSTGVSQSERLRVPDSKPANTNPVYQVVPVLADYQQQENAGYSGVPP